MAALIVLLDFSEHRLSSDRVFANWNRLKQTVLGLPHSEERIDLANCDARCLPLSDASVDLLITSPPYINVFNYHQKYRKSMEAIGWKLLEVARSEIGANRKHRANRFLTVTQYCIDMTDALLEFVMVCNSAGRLIVVVGRESNVRKTRFFNGDIVVRLAERCAGLTPEFRQERVFTNRFGNSIYEDILHFVPYSPHKAELAQPTQIALEVLDAALEHAPAESRSDLADAIRRVDAVQPSPPYQTQLRKEGA